jgi:hypothetical protein
MDTKFCRRCGKPLDGYSFCGGCGMQEVQPYQPPREQPHYQQYYYHQQQQQYYRQQYNKQAQIQGYRNLGGWLLFFVVWDIIGLPITLGSMAFSLLFNFSVLTLCSAALSLVPFLLTVISIIQIFTRNPMFLRTFQMATILGAMSGIFGTIITSWDDLSDPFIMIGFAIGAVIGLFLAVAIYFLFTLYYCKSVRVRVYMGSDEYAENALFAFKQKPRDW